MIGLNGIPEPPRPANRSQRLFALVIDAALLLIIANVLFGLLALLLVALEAAGAETAAFDIASAVTPIIQAIRGAPRLAVAAVLYGLYVVPFWALAGTTLGKWLVGVRVARRGTSDRPGIGRALVRFIAFAVLLPITWMAVLNRQDGAGLHDLIARTRPLRATDSGVRRILRGGIRRAVRSPGWVAAALGVIVLVGAGIFGAVKLQGVLNFDPGRTVLAIDAVTQEAVKGAILEYDRIEEQATLRRDAQMLHPRATSDWIKHKEQEFDALKNAGVFEDSHLVDANFKGFRRIGDNQVEADVVETWQTSVFNSQGQLVQQLPSQPVPQTATLMLEGDRWKLHDVRFYEAGQVPF
ncbi:MAG TPA: RDD family protein [Chloroflexota bacterium]